jgi:mannose-6-phosphate isomerase-like protein (cupin superfamily)
VSKSRGKVYKLNFIEKLVDHIKKENRIGAWISKNQEDRYAVIVRTFDHENGIAELHEKSDDIYYVLDGKAKIVLNGNLNNPKEKDTGELIAESIDDGDTYQIEQGDIIEIPRGTPHQVICANSYMQNLTIKVYSGKPYIPPFAHELKHNGRNLL